MQGDTTKAKAAYQDFLTLWKDADRTFPFSSLRRRNTRSFNSSEASLLELKWTVNGDSRSRKHQSESCGQFDLPKTTSVHEVLR